MSRLALVLVAAQTVGCMGDIGEIPADEAAGGSDAIHNTDDDVVTTSGSGGASSTGAGGQGGSWVEPAPRCPDDMVEASGVCIDRFEAPNIEGAAPLAMQTAYDGEAWCAERDKRLCTDQEWIGACEGSTQSLYPYGDSYEAHRCNDDKVWRVVDWGALGTWPAQAAQDEAASLYQADPSGSRAACVSEAGAFDLTGNVAEWVVRTLPGGEYDHVMKGCYWAGCYGGTPPNCTFKNPAHPGHFRSYEAGFRCCRDAG